MNYFEGISNIPIGFDFYSWEDSYNTVTIYMNGWISLGTPPSFIAANYMDLYPISGYYIKYQTTGSPPNRKFIVSYHVGYFVCRSSIMFTDFQIVLFETTNNIKINIASHPGCNNGISNQYIKNNDNTKII